MKEKLGIGSTDASANPSHSEAIVEHQTTTSEITTNPSHRQLIDLVASQKNYDQGSGSLRNFRSLVSTWCKYHGETLDSLARITLEKSDFESRLSEVTDHIAQVRGAKASSKNIRAAVRELKRAFDRVLLNGELPLNFHEAFCVALERNGLTAHSLGLKLETTQGYSKFVRSTLMRYASGRIHPQKKKAFLLISNIEEALELEKGALTSRAFKQAMPIMQGCDSPIPYRENLKKQLMRVYKLKVFPPQILTVWNEIVIWRTQPIVRVDENIFTRKPGEYWAKSATKNKAEGTLLFYFGFLCLPKSETSDTSPSLIREARATSGKGMTIEEIGIQDLFDLRLLLDYFEFLRARNVDDKYTTHCLNVLRLLSSWVNSPIAFFNAHPQFSGLFKRLNAADEKWEDFLAGIHKKLLDLKRQLERTIDAPSRDPGAALKLVFEDADPYGIFLELAKRLNADLPPRLHKASRAIAFRDLVIVSMLLEVPLRSRNTLELEVGKNIFRDEKSKIWTVTILKKDLKNHHSNHAQDIHRSYSAATSALIEEYWSIERLNLRNPSLSNILFIPGERGQFRRKQNLERHGIGAADLYVLIHKISTRYFGIGTGTNVFRHLIATGILKADSSRYAAAAAVLNNSEEMIRQNYSHINQQDELRTAGNWREEQIKKFNMSDDKNNPLKK